MKIAFVYDAVYPWIRGGAERRIYEIASRLAPRHEVHIYGVKWWKGPAVLKQKHITYHGVCNARELYIKGRRSINEAITFALALIKPLIREKFDIIDVSAFPYFSIFTTKIAASIHHTPLVITWHEVWGDYWYEYLGTLGGIGKLIETLATKIPAHHIAVSKHTATRLSDATVIPNGIDLNLIDSIPEAEKGFDVIFAGRLIREKRVDLLIKAIAEVNATCAIIGEGPEGSTLKKLTAEQDIENRISHIDFQPYARVISLFKASKIFVLPSHREGFGMAALEAMACRLPVITVNTPNNATTELIQHNNGLVVKPNPQDIAENINHLLTHETQRAEMAENARHFAETHNWEEIVAKAEKTYTEIINKHKN
jgi:glycosyltransferase involved in cell wall biosynthesis